MTGNLPTVPLGGQVGDPSGHPRWDGERIQRYDALTTAVSAYTDALLALEELGHEDVVDRLRARWPEVPRVEVKE